VFVFLVFVDQFVVIAKDRGETVVLVYKIFLPNGAIGDISWRKS